MVDPGANVDPDEEEELVRGGTLGRYVVLDRLGRGAMGSVYAAYDPELARRVALKVLRAGAALRQGHEAARQRLLREAQALARLAHPNVVRVFDVGTDRGRVFLAMELVEGQSLRRWLEVPRAWREVVDVLEQAGRGLAAAHALGLVHRDFKPDNVLVGEDGRARVGDFGLVRRIDDDAALEPATSELEADAGSGSSLTAVGDVLGTPAYMAPEQHAGEDAGPRSDQYAFCVTAFEALYGRRPFDMDDREALVVAKRRGLGSDADPPGTAGRVPRSVRAVVRRGLSPVPADRFEAMAPLLAALGRARVRAGSWRVGVVVGLVVLGGAGMMMARPGDTSLPCAEAGAVPSMAWDEATRDVVRRRLGELGSGDAAERAVIELDRRVAAWVTADRDACEDTWVRGEQSSVRLAARQECLRGQWIELEETVSLLRRADAATAAHVDALVQGVPAAEECEAARVHAHAPATGEVDGPRRTRARAAVLRRAGRLDEAWVELQTERGEGAGGSARALERGMVLAARGDHEASEEELHRALQLARAAGEDRIEAEAWLGLATAAVTRGGDPEWARSCAEMATAAVRAAGGDASIESRAEALLAELARR